MSGTAGAHYAAAHSNCHPHHFTRAAERIPGALKHLISLVRGVADGRQSAGPPSAAAGRTAGPEYALSGQRPPMPIAMNCASHLLRVPEDDERSSSWRRYASLAHGALLHTSAISPGTLPVDESERSLQHVLAGGDD